ncbi:helix-turn-helix transcriptional regulator [Pseudocitrobacter cyperus]|uniref:Helix-turn-helix transcriptional regulator n=1 Tax=Pseudocitrobacter cyperus TaxID=3112843 RepID=A0ABV0HPK4_9ENTR
MNALTLAEPRYQVRVLSNNYFFWLGVKNLVRQQAKSMVDVQWIKENADSQQSLLCQEIYATPVAQKWLVFTESEQVDTLSVMLPDDRVNILSDRQKLGELQEQLQNPTFSRRRRDKQLTRSEARVCSLIRQGFTLVRIAQILNKSPKTIYTHKRNAMDKFHCDTLVEFNRKMNLMERQALYS